MELTSNRMSDLQCYLHWFMFQSLIMTKSVYHAETLHFCNNSCRQNVISVKFQIAYRYRYSKHPEKLLISIWNIVYKSFIWILNLDPPPVISQSDFWQGITIHRWSLSGDFMFHIRFLSSRLDNIPIWNKNTPTS